MKTRVSTICLSLMFNAVGASTSAQRVSENSYQRALEL